MTGPTNNGISRGRVTQTSLSEINVTPLVDVMLVLLIVFMVSAPLMQQGVQVNLPKAKSGSIDEAPDKLMLEVTKDLEIRINGKSIPKGTLSEKLLAIASVKPEVQVFVQADERVPYGYIAQVMAEVKNAKISRVGLVTQPGEPKERL